jgi:hypothetical protein
MADAALFDNPLSALRQFSGTRRRSDEEQCELCGAAIPTAHRHMLDIASRQVLCACRPCTILFDTPAAGAGKRRLIPDRYLQLDGFHLGDGEWESLNIPVGMVFVTHSSIENRPVAIYPSPMGPTESLLTLETWSEIEADNPVVKTLEPDVEALLVNRMKSAREYFVVPIDECYKLVGLIRVYWKGLAGGGDVWEHVDEFFAQLRERSSVIGAQDA